MAASLLKNLLSHNCVQFQSHCLSTQSWWRHLLCFMRPLMNSKARQIMKVSRFPFFLIRKKTDAGFEILLWLLLLLLCQPGPPPSSETKKKMGINKNKRAAKNLASLFIKAQSCQIYWRDLHDLFRFFVIFVGLSRWKDISSRSREWPTLL